MQSKILFPPRPGGAINPERLGDYSGYMAQYKYSDIRTLIYVMPDGRIELFTRSREPHRSYILTSGMREALEDLMLPLGSQHVLDGGILRSRVASGEFPIILWDVLVYRGRHLVGTTYQYRHRLLLELTGHPQSWETSSGKRLALQINGPLWLAPTFRGGFERHYQNMIQYGEVEGLVLKNPLGRLERALTEENNGDWQIRVRKPHPNYRF